MNTRSWWLLCAGLLCCIWTCTAQSLDERPFDWVPPHLALNIPSPDRNPLTEPGVALGHKLFFDPILSGENTISCASCHQPDLAFSDGLVVSDKGASKHPLVRHTPSLMNLAWADGFFWDGGGFDLESQAFAPLEHPDEMNQDLNLLLQELQQHESYPALFDEAFEDGLNLPNVVRALAQFQRTLVAADSLYDDALTQHEGAQLSDAQEAGFALVQTHCVPCHATHFFTDFSYRNNGLDSIFLEDHEKTAWGRARITLDEDDIGKFKVPSLRNVAITAPYMHDGRLTSLNEVLEHYSSGVQDSPTLDPSLRREDGTLGIPLTTQERIEIIAFLETLTDRWLGADARFRKPTED